MRPEFHFPDLYDFFMMKGLLVFALSWVSIARAIKPSVSDQQRHSIVDFQTTNLTNTLGTACGCAALRYFASGAVILPNATEYLTQTTSYWDVREDLSPGCVFVPDSAHDVALGVTVARVCEAKFAIRGGGHMPVSRTCCGQ
jgi:hypothetical protein